MNPLLAGLARYFSPDQLAAMRAAHVGIAGAGGLGSNVAMLLTRCGLGELTVIDCDVVDASNLNRQFFWPDQLGQPKVEALAANLLRLNPAMRVHPLRLCLDETNCAQIIEPIELWAEALDEPRAKAMFVRQALAQGKRVAAASGICGCSGPAMQTRQLGNLTLAGDFCSDFRTKPPLAPRVCQAAAMLADALLARILPGLAPGSCQ